MEAYYSMFVCMFVFRGFGAPHRLFGKQRGSPTHRGRSLADTADS